MELNRIELHTIVYMGKEMNTFLKKMDKNEDDNEDGDDDPYDKLIKESLYGQEEKPMLPTGYKGRVRINPRDVEMENETFSLEQTQSENPHFDNVELVLKSGETIVVTESMDEYLKIREEYFEWEKAYDEAEDAKKRPIGSWNTQWGNGNKINLNWRENGDCSSRDSEGV